MADVEVSYENTLIKSLSASGQAVLHTAGKYCDDDITIDYTAPGGGSELKVTTGTSTNVNLSGTFSDLENIEITAGSSGSARYLSAFSMYGAIFTQGVDILYKNFLSLTASASTASYDFYRTVRNIKSVDYGGASLPNSLQRFWYNAENSNSANWIQHTTYIKGLIWDNVTTMSSCFQANNDYDTQVTKGQYIDIDFGTSEISGNLNFAPATNYFRFTHDTLISLISCLKNGVSGTVKIGQKNLDTLSSAEIAVATAKGWTISA